MKIKVLILVYLLGFATLGASSGSCPLTSTYEVVEVGAWKTPGKIVPHNNEGFSKIAVQHVCAELPLTSRILVPSGSLHSFEPQIWHQPTRPSVFTSSGLSPPV